MFYRRGSRLPQALDHRLGGLRRSSATREYDIGEAQDATVYVQILPQPAVEVLLAGSTVKSWS
jgi:hypothetical protein